MKTAWLTIARLFTFTIPNMFFHFINWIISFTFRTNQSCIDIFLFFFINKEFHTVKKETIHIGNVGIKGKRFKNTKFDNNLVERLQGTVRDRNKTQRGLKSEESVFVKGHKLYYNFIKPHEGLNGYTPAHFANIYLDLKDKKWENLLKNSIKHQKSF